MKEYRCTRNAPYTHPCDGRFDSSARNGYYIRAQTVQEARAITVERFPEETSFGFAVDEWKNLSSLADRSAASSGN